MPPVQHSTPLFPMPICNTTHATEHTISTKGSQDKDSGKDTHKEERIEEIHHVYQKNVLIELLRDRKIPLHRSQPSMVQIFMGV